MVDILESRRSPIGFAILVCVSSLLLSNAALAADQSWNGDSGVNGNWSLGANWIGDPVDAAVPGENAGDTATFGTGMTISSLTYNAAAPDQLINMVVDESVTINVPAGKTLDLATLSISSGATLTLGGDGDIRIGTLSGTGGLNISSPDIEVFHQASFDFSTLSSYSNQGVVYLAGTSSTYSFASIPDMGSLVVGDSGTASLVTFGTALNTSGRLSIAEDWILSASNSISVGGDFASESNSTALISGELTVGGGLNLAGTLDLSADCAVNGADSVLNSGATVVLDALSSLEFNGGGSLTIDRGASTNISGTFIVGAAGLTIQDSDQGGLQAISPNLNISGTLEIQGTLADQKLIGMHPYAVVLNISGAIFVSDTAGVSVELDESRLVLSSGTIHQVGLTATPANFDGSFEFQSVIADGSVAFINLPAGTDVSLGDLRMQNDASVTATGADLVLNGRYENTGSGTVSASTGSVAPGDNFVAENDFTFDSVDVIAGESVRLSGNVTVSGDVTIGTGATLGIAGSGATDTTNVSVQGMLTLQDGAQLTVGTTTAADLAVTLTLGDDLNAVGGSINVGAAGDPLTLTSGNVVTLMIGGDLLLGDAGGSSASLSMFADSQSLNGSTALTIEGDVQTKEAGSTLWIGEGSITFGGDLDFALSSDGMRLAAGMQSTSLQPQISLTKSGTIQFNTGINGSDFALQSLSTGSSLQVDGDLVLVGDLSLSGSAAASPFSMGAADKLFIGKSSFPVSSILTLNAGSTTIGDLVIVESNDGNATSHNQLTVQRSTAGSGSATFSSILVEGDTQNSDGGQTVNERNGGELTFDAITATVSGALIVEDGASSGEELGGAGLGITNSIVTVSDVSIGNSANNASDPLSSANLDLNGSTLIFSDGGSLQTSQFATLSIDTSTLQSLGANSWTFDTHREGGTLVIHDSTVTAGASGGLTLSLGALAYGSEPGLDLHNVSFSNFDEDGLFIKNQCEVSRFESCDFSTGSAGGSHITFEGDVYSPSGGRVFADLNRFDASTISGGFANISAGAGNIVSVASDAAVVALTFRAPSVGDLFGDDGVTTLTALLAENDDGDGTESVLGGDADDDLLWEELPTLTVGAAGAYLSNTAKMRAGVADQVIGLFTLGASGANATVESIEISVDDSQLTVGNFTTGSATDFKLFADTGTITGEFDTGDTILATNDGSNLGSGTLGFDMTSSPQTLSDGANATWGIAAGLASGTQGEVSVSIASSQVTLSNPDMIFIGFPLEESTEVLLGDLSVVEASSNPDPDDVKGSVLQRDNPVVLAFQVSNSASAQQARVTAINLTIEASNGTLSDTELGPLTKYLVLFVSNDSTLDTTYQADISSGFGQSGDDAFFDFAQGGSSEIQFSNGVANVLLQRSGGSLILPGDTLTFFAVFDGSDDPVLARKADDVNQYLRFSITDAVGDGSAGAIITSAGSRDAIVVTENVVTPANTISGSYYNLQTQVSLATSSSSGCKFAIQRNDSRGFLLLLAFLGCLVLVQMFRRRIA